MDLGVYEYEEVEETLELSDVEMETAYVAPGKRYVRNAKAMAATPADVKEYTDKYVFVLDMPGVKCSDIRVHAGENRVLYVNAKRKRSDEEMMMITGNNNVQSSTGTSTTDSGDQKGEEEKKEIITSGGRDNKGVMKYLSMERRMGKFMKRFALPEDANTDSISAVYKDGVLFITVEKKPPPEPKKTKLIEVKVA